MEVILLESLNKLGGIGDLVNVKDGFARNYLIPQKKALRANQENKEYFAKIKKELIEKNKNIVEEAKLKLKKILDIEVIFIRNASDNGQLYGSVSPKDIANYFIEKKIEVKPSDVNLHNAIKKIGIYDINIKLHPDVGSNLKINVATTLENAKVQKSEYEKPKENKELEKNEKSQKKIVNNESLESSTESKTKDKSEEKSSKKQEKVEEKKTTKDEKNSDQIEKTKSTTNKSAEKNKE